MTVRGPVDSAFPAAQQPAGYVEIDGKRYEVKLDEAWRRHFEQQWKRSGEFDDETFDNDAQIGDLQGAIADAAERLEAIEQAIQQDRAIDAALDDLQTRLAAIESLPTIQENADVAGQIEAVQFGIQSLEEQIFTAPRGIDIVTDNEVARNAAIKNSKLDYPRQESIYDQSDTGQLSESSGERTLLQVSFTDVGSPHFVTAAGTQFKFRNDGSGNQASAAGLTFTLRLRVGSTDMSSHSYGSNQTVYSAVATSSLDGGLTTFTPSVGIIMLLSSSIFSFPATGATQYAALTGELTGGGGSDTCNIADDDTKLVITGFANIEA